VLESLTPPKSLVDQVYDVILDALCDGTFKPGERLTQENIAERLNVSRQPVTHALAVLKAQGFLAQGRQGLTVTLATPRLTKEAIARGRELVEHGRSVVASGDAGAALKADMDFHSFIYEVSGNPLIAETMRLHWRHLRRAMGKVLRHPGMSVSVWKEHGRILDSMIRGDTEGAAELMRKHLVEAYDRVGAMDTDNPSAS